MWWNTRRAIQNPKRWCYQSVALNMSANLENPAVATDWKMSVPIPVPKKSRTKECSNHWTIALISHATKVMLKTLHSRLQYYVKQELPDIQAGFRKGRGTRDQIANICRIIEKAREFQKNISVSLTMLKPLTVWIMTNCGKFLERCEYQTILPVSWETCMWVKRQELELCMEQLTGSRLRKEYSRAVTLFV